MKSIWRWLVIGIFAVVAVGLVAPRVSANRFRPRIQAALDDVAQRYSATPASVALAWQIARPSITAPIASATTTDQLNELLAATQLKLDHAAIEQLDTASG